jgi:hypothetical protein
MSAGKGWFGCHLTRLAFATWFVNFGVPQKKDFQHDFFNTRFPQNRNGCGGDHDASCSGQ